MTWGFARRLALWAAACAVAAVLAGAGVAVCAAAGAGGQMAYADQATRISIAAPGETAGVDLFANFKDVMPGDILSQDIVVENGDVKGRTGEFYLIMKPAAGADDAALELLSQVQLTVSQGGKVLYSGAPGKQRDQKSVYLGILEEGESLELTADLTVPLEMGDDVAFTSGALNWVFRMDECDDGDDSNRDDDDDDDTDGGKDGERSAETGDDMGRMLLAGAGLVLVGAAAAVIARRKSRE